MRRIVLILVTLWLAIMLAVYRQNGMTRESTENIPDKELISVPGSGAPVLQVSEKHIISKNGSLDIIFEPATLGMVAKDANGTKLTISEPIIESSSFTIDRVNSTIKYEELPYDIKYNCGDYGFSIAFIPKQTCTVTWPLVKHDIRRTSLIIPFHEGSYIPLSDRIWREYLLKDTFNTTESLSMPFWGLECGSYTVTYMIDNPFYNGISFRMEKGTVTSVFTHAFSDKFDVGVPITYNIWVDEKASPIIPAKHLDGIWRRRDR